MGHVTQMTIIIPISKYVSITADGSWRTVPYATASKGTGLCGQHCKETHGFDSSLRLVGSMRDRLQGVIDVKDGYTIVIGYKSGKWAITNDWLRP